VTDIFSVPLCGAKFVTGEYPYRNKRGVLGCCCPVPDIWSEEGLNEHFVVVLNEKHCGSFTTLGI